MNNTIPKLHELIECLTFDALAKAVVSGGCDQAVMALENSIAGSILSNYAILDQYELVIIGEYYLSIEHNLMALPGQKIEDHTGSPFSSDGIITV